MELSKIERLILNRICCTPGGLKASRKQHERGSALQHLIDLKLVRYNTSQLAYFETPSGRKVWVAQ